MTIITAATSRSRRASWLGSWRVALRLARRDALRSKGRTILVAAMVGIPVLLVGVLSTVYHTDRVSVRESLPERLGASQAMIQPQGRSPISQSPDLSSYGFNDAPGASQQPWTAAEIQRLTGGRLLPTEAGTVRLSHGTAPSIDAVQTGARELDATDPAARGAVRRLTGRLPRQAGDIAVTARLAHDGFGVGTTAYDAANGRSVRVVGTYTSQSMGTRDEQILGLPGALLAPGSAADGSRTASYLLVRSTPVTWAEVQRLNATGLTVLSRDVVEHPPANSSLAPDQRVSRDRSLLAIVSLALVSIVIEIVLLAGPAFAVGVRRRQRDLALLAAAGSTPRDVRRTVLAQAVILGAGAALIGAVAALPVSVLVIRIFRARGDAFGPYDWRPLELLAAVVIGGLAALLAALVPAIQAARSDVATVLAGRRGTVTSRRGWPVFGLALLALSTGVIFWRGTHAGGELWVEAGTIGLALGGVACTPWMVGRVGTLATRLPLPLRLAVRDAARQRGRTAPAVAAIMASVIGITALAIGAASNFAQERQTYQPKLGLGGAIVRVPASSDGGPSATQPGPEAVAHAVDTVLPGRQTFLIDDVGLTILATDGTTLPTRVVSVVPRGCTPADVVTPGDSTKQSCANPGGAVNSQFDTAAMDPAALQALGTTLDAHAQQVLKSGGVLVASASLISGGHVELVKSDQASDGTATIAGTVTVPAAALPRPGKQALFAGRLVMTAQTARGLGAHLQPSALAIAGPTLTAAQETRLSNLEGSIGGADVYVERGYHDDYSVIFILLAVLGGLMVLVGSLTATGLALAESRPDLATLGAVGAAPRTRRIVGGAQAVVIGLMGTALGVALGFVPGIAVTWPLTAQNFVCDGQAQCVRGGGPVITIPWLLLGIIVIAVPVVAGLVAGLFTRSRLPMIRRLAT
jgi:putative ABC transport system permease protein